MTQTDRPSRLCIGWPVSDRFGWGVFGFNLLKELLQNPAYPKPILGVDPYFPEPLAGLQPVLDQLKVETDQISTAVAHLPAGQKVNIPDTLMLHALHDDFAGKNIITQVDGVERHGFIFYEDTDFSEDGLRRSQYFHSIFTGSKWNQEYLQRRGLNNVKCVVQGIDPNLFTPNGGAVDFGSKFTVYSGGKFEYRKAQDIVVSAFKIFHERHPDSQLVCNWHSPWGESAINMHQSPLVNSVPQADPTTGKVDFDKWALACGLKPGSFVDLGEISNAVMPHIYRAVSVAVFPNRAEGGTNLVAMEAMACGAPCIIAANTGQKDLIEGDNCYPLYDQGVIDGDNRIDWGETPVEAVVAQLETVYQDWTAAKKRGLEGAKFMEGWAWSNQIKLLMNELGYQG